MANDVFSKELPVQHLFTYSKGGVEPELIGRNGCSANKQEEIEKLQAKIKIIEDEKIPSLQQEVNADIAAGRTPNPDTVRRLEWCKTKIKDIQENIKGYQNSILRCRGM